MHISHYCANSAVCQTICSCRRSLFQARSTECETVRGEADIAPTHREITGKRSSLTETLYDFVYCVKSTEIELGYLNSPLEPLAWLLLDKEKQKITRENPLSLALKDHPRLLEDGSREREKGGRGGRKGGHKHGV